MNDSDVPKFVTPARALLPARPYGRRVAPYFRTKQDWATWNAPPEKKRYTSDTRNCRRFASLRRTHRRRATEEQAGAIGKPHNFQRRRLAVKTSAVLAIEASDNSKVAIRASLTEDLKCVSAEETRYAINLSLGAVRVNICSNAPIGEWMVRADQAMREQKRRRLNRLSERPTVLQTN